MREFFEFSKIVFSIVIAAVFCVFGFVFIVNMTKYEIKESDGCVISRIGASDKNGFTGVILKCKDGVQRQAWVIAPQIGDPYPSSK